MTFQGFLGPHPRLTPLDEGSYTREGAVGFPILAQPPSDLTGRSQLLRETLWALVRRESALRLGLGGTGGRSCRPLAPLAVRFAIRAPGRMIPSGSSRRFDSQRGGMRQSVRWRWVLLLWLACAGPVVVAGEAEWKANILAGQLAYNRGDYRGATAPFELALKEAELVFGREHPNTASTVERVATLYQAQGRYADAESLFRRSLAIREKVLGAQHRDVAASLNNLALLYWAQDRTAEAEPLYRRALVIMEKAIGAEDPALATGLNNLALIYQAQGRYADAEPLFRRSLAIREKALGPEHSDVAQSLNNLAGLYKELGRYSDAEPLYRRALM